VSTGACVRLTAATHHYHNTSNRLWGPNHFDFAHKLFALFFTPARPSSPGRWSRLMVAAACGAVSCAQNDLKGGQGSRHNLLLLENHLGLGPGKERERGSFMNLVMGKWMNEVDE